MTTQLAYGPQLIHVKHMLERQQHAYALLNEYQQRREIWDNRHPLGRALIAGHVALLNQAELEASQSKKAGLLPLAWEGTAALTDWTFEASNGVSA